MEEKSWRDLKEDFNGGVFRRLYLFHGEEEYLREHYVKMLLRRAVGEDFPEFNIKKFEGALPLRELSDAVEAFPMNSERTVVLIRGFDIFKSAEDIKGGLLEIFSDIPEHCSVALVSDDEAIKADKRKNADKKLLSLICAVNFKKLSPGDMTKWVRSRFKEDGLSISDENIGFLIFYCGEFMRDLIPEIEKIIAHAKGAEVTKREIEEAASGLNNAVVFQLTDALAEKDFRRAVSISEKLRLREEPPIMVLAMMARQFRQLYHARLVLDAGGGPREFMPFWGLRSDFIARKILASARKLDLGWIARGIRLCEEADFGLKTGGMDEHAPENVIAYLSVP